jgi:LCP family protein required for cell wall assembly
MSDRPHGGRGQSGDEGPEYGWLYGGKAQSSDPEPTQVMPAVRPQRSTSGSGGSGSGGSKVTGTSARRPSSGGPRRPRRSVRKILLTILAIWVVFLIVVPIWAWSTIDKVDATPTAARPSDQPGTTYLLVGSDSRKGLTKAENKRLGTGGVGDVGQRTDTIMLLHTGDGPSMLLSIPRDSIVPIPGHGTGKINAAFAYGGPKLLVRTIEQNTGVKVDDYVEIGFGGFVNAVDAVGGVTICPKTRIDDRRAALHVKKGCQEVNGITALGYSRSRHAFALGDITRAQHQREVVSAIGAKVKSPWTVINPWRYFRLNQAATTSIKISKGMSPLALAEFGFAMTRVNGSSGLTCGMPIADLAVHWDSTRAKELLAYVKQDKTADIPKKLCTASGQPK